jgi:K+-transporting ATPase ATPase C chain
MLAHLRANLWLLVLSVVICCGIYPLALWAIGQTLFNGQANGSLVLDKDGKPIGSRLIAQEFKGEEYFQSRPSAVSYNGAGSGASNWGANNYNLRDRVARALGPIVKYKTGPNKGKEAAPDIVKWFRDEKPGAAADWAKAHGGLAQAFVKSDDVMKDFVKDWFKQHAAEFDAWKKENPGKNDPPAEDLAGAFFESFAKENPGTWLTIAEKKDNKGEPVKNDKGGPVKVVKLVKKTSDDAADIAAVFFDTWRQEHPNVELEDVPADMVMASGSGLDPHITLKNAQYQLDRVAEKWAELTKRDAAKVRTEIEQILNESKSAPMWGLVGVDLVNVMDVNLALRVRFSEASLQVR